MVCCKNARNATRSGFALLKFKWKKSKTGMTGYLTLFCVFRFGSVEKALFLSCVGYNPVAFLNLWKRCPDSLCSWITVLVACPEVRSSLLIADMTPLLLSPPSPTLNQTKFPLPLQERDLVRAASKTSGRLGPSQWLMTCRHAHG